MLALQPPSLSDDTEESNRILSGPEPEAEDLDWDGYSASLEHRAAAVGDAGLQIYWQKNLFVFIKIFKN